MKQIIPFSKELLFETKVSEITTISLDHQLKLEHGDTISGVFTISGEYLISEISVNKNPFQFEVPFEITLNQLYQTGDVKIDIDDFYYEIIHDEILRIYIDILIDPIEEQRFIKEIIELPKEELDLKKQEIENLFEEVETIPEVSHETETKEEVLNATSKVEPTASENKLKSLFDSFANEEELYTTYHVHIVREEDSIEKIISTYQITKEELALYNKIDSIAIGDKIIIPEHQNE